MIGAFLADSCPAGLGTHRRASTLDAIGITAFVGNFVGVTYRLCQVGPSGWAAPQYPVPTGIGRGVPSEFVLCNRYLPGRFAPWRDRSRSALFTCDE